jgi:hypothetical protein
MQLLSYRSRNQTEDVGLVGTSNIDLFRFYAGATFGLLYESFPISRNLTHSELIGSCGNDERSRHEQIIIETWRWLMDTGYLRQIPDTGAFDLTLKSFDALTILDGPDETACRGAKLAQFTKQVGRHAVSETVAEIVAKVLGSGAIAAYTLLR